MSDARVRYRYWRYFVAGETIVPSYEDAVRRAREDISDGAASPYAIETLDGELLLDDEGIHNLSLDSPDPASLPLAEKG